VADLVLRFWIAEAFLVSGMHHMMGVPADTMLTHAEEMSRWLGPTTLSKLLELIEWGGGILLLVGLATRTVAVALLIMVLVTHFTQQVSDRYLLTAMLLAWYICAGAGSLSLDSLLSGLARSAVPFAGTLLRIGERVRLQITPAYLAVLRWWLAVTLAFAATAQATQAHGGNFDVLMRALPYASAPRLAPMIMAILAALLVTGTVTRYVAIALIFNASVGAMIDLRYTSELYWIGILVLLAFHGSGGLSMDRALRRWLVSRYPQIVGTAAFAPGDVPRVIIIGAGFGGLSCATALRRAPVAVTLVDRCNHHLFQPLLYQVATAGLSPGDIAAPVRPIFRDSSNIEVLFGAVTSVDVEARQVQIGTKRLAYDYLVLATGATHGYFGQDTWREHAPGLKRIEDATEIRRRLLTAFERAEATDDPSEREALLTFLIVGGGPTGVELAGAIAELTRHGMHKDFRRFDPATAHIILVQAGGRVLPTFPEPLSRIAQRSLERLGVDVRTNCRVEYVDHAGVRVNGQTIGARTVLWAAGVVASPAGRWLGAQSDPAGRVKVDTELRVPGCHNVYAVGDTAASNAWNGKAVPGLAPAAKQGGHYVAQHIIAQVTGQPLAKPFLYRHAGNLATIGRKAAVVELGRLRLWGAPAWWLWGLVHVGLLVGMRNRVATLVNWFWAYLTFGSAIRLITGGAEGSQTSPSPPPAPVGFAAADDRSRAQSTAFHR
jgi:NADH dehydrogenase/putative oxidoreductase